MAEQNNMTTCRNGHRQPSAGSKFCIYCGISMNAPPPNVQPQQQQNPFPPQPPVNPNYPQNYQNFPPQQQQQFPPNNQPIQQYPNQPPFQPVQQIFCRTCGGNGQHLARETYVCPECKWLRPLTPGYGIDASAFQWAADGKAMSALRSVTPLNLAAQAVSDKVGRRWIEVTFNGVLLGEKQMPDIYEQAVKAARILGMSKMPDIYLSGERMWDCLTFGSDKDSFVVIGTAIAGNYRGDDLLFLLAREMGHCRAGHALWKTVIRFFLGEQGPKKGFMSGGIFAALSPSALIGGAMEMPLLGWARQAEITADRAGLLAVGDEEVARRVLLSWSLKSPFLYKQINVEEWLKQQAASDDDFTRLSELTTTSTPYITRRLKLMEEFAKSADLRRWRDLIEEFIHRSQVLKIPPNQIPKETKTKDNDLKIKCSKCQTPMRVPLKVLEGKAQLAIRCPNKECGKITTIKKSVKTVSTAKSATSPSQQPKRNLNYDD